MGKEPSFSTLLLEICIFQIFKLHSYPGGCKIMLLYHFYVCMLTDSF